MDWVKNHATIDRSFLTIKMNSPESYFLKYYFSKLNTSDIEYAVMRNWESLPDSLGGSDLDILTNSSSSAKLIAGIAEQTAIECGGTVTSLYKVETIVMTLAGRKKDGTWWGLHIDIFPMLCYKSISYLSTKHVLYDSVFENNQFYRCCGLGDVVAFLKECLYNGKTKKDYYTKARLVFSKNPELIENATNGYYSKKSEVLLRYLLEKERDVDKVRQFSKKLRRSLLSRALLSTNLYQILCAKYKNIYRRLSRIFIPPGYVVSFLGTDGAGKSSIIKDIIPLLNRMMHSEAVYEHMRPNLLPSLARLFGRPVNEGPTINPHANKPSGFIGSFVRLVYYSFDYVIGYWLKVYPNLVKRPTMYVFDRYYYDYIIDPKRSRINLPQWIIKAFGYMIPQPDLIICLGADPRVIYNRKSELPLGEVSRQVNELKYFCDKEKRAIWVDTGCSIKESADIIIDTIINKMAARYKEQNKLW